MRKIELEKAIDLWKNGNYKEFNQLLMKLVQEFPDNATINYQCAWSFDLLEEESRAVTRQFNDVYIPSKEYEG